MQHRLGSEDSDPFPAGDRPPNLPAGFDAAPSGRRHAVPADQPIAECGKLVKYTWDGLLWAVHAGTDDLCPTCLERAPIL